MTLARTVPIIPAPGHARQLGRSGGCRPRSMASAGTILRRMEAPLPPLQAMKRIHAILDHGTVLHSVPRALEELESGRVTRVDCVNVLRAGVVEAAEGRPGSYRYPVRTVRFNVVVEFLSE